MTIVFGGLDLPVFEMLFIVSLLLFFGLVVMLIGLFYIVKELRQLKKLLSEEEDDIAEFGRDVSELENFEGTDKAISTVKKYIENATKNGFTWDQVKEKLISQGWDDKKLDDINRKMNK